MAMLVEMKSAMKEAEFYPMACGALDLRMESYARADKTLVVLRLLKYDADADDPFSVARPLSSEESASISAIL
jgi:hypothetical protein